MITAKFVLPRQHFEVCVHLQALSHGDSDHCLHHPLNFIVHVTVKRLLPLPQLVARALHMCFTYAGAYLPVEVTQVSGSTGASHGQQLMLQLPSGLRRGAVQIEIARGGFISHAVVSSAC